MSFVQKFRFTRSDYTCLYCIKTYIYTSVSYGYMSFIIVNNGKVSI